MHYLNPGKAESQKQDQGTGEEGKVMRPGTSVLLTRHMAYP